MSHEHYIQRCLQIAKNGNGTTRPNPSVGAVIVHQNKIIGEGYTSAYGGNHAEVNAINAVKNQELLKEATIYVTLEPCAHFGKTPPCANLIVERQLPNVVIGCVDTNSLVAGKGIEILKKAGINVTVGVLENQCLQHHKLFFTVQNKKRPYIILKWAQTQDGFIAPFYNTEKVISSGVEKKDEAIPKNKKKLPQQTSLLRNEAKPVWISNSYSQQLVHKWRSEEQAILVGTNTVLADNPSLTVRSWTGKNPIRIVLDKSLRIPKNATVFDGNVKTIVFTESKDSRQKNTDICYYEHNEVISYKAINFSKNIAKQICEVLYKHNIQSVIIEGGAQTLQTFIDENLWDEARVFTGENTFGVGVKSPVLSATVASEENIKNDILRTYIND